MVMDEPHKLLPDDDSPEAVAYRLQRYGIRARPGDSNLYRSGGVVCGPGTGTDDSVLVRVSGCIFYGPPMSEANRRALEYINAGGPIPPFATGGLIPGTT